MQKRFRRCRYLALTIAAVCIFLLFSYNSYLPTTKTLLSKYTVTGDISTSALQPLRKSLLIVGQGRSGTSFVAKMIANGDRVSKYLLITVPEPNSLNRVESIFERPPSKIPHQSSSRTSGHLFSARASYSCSDE